jgi:hypothetical protein
MIHPALLLALPLAICSPASAPWTTPSAEARSDLESVYGAAATWPEFYAGAEARRAVWERNWTQGQVPEDLLERARATGGPWKILAITEAACSDSVNTIPYLALLAEALESTELRVVNATVGRPWMEAHRSPDGRASTPTVLLLDGDWQIRGCWIEQPVGLQAFWLDVVARNAMAQEVGRKMAWYEEEAGQETLREFVEVMEAAHTDSPICPGLVPAG